jgi:hypothetical protein
MADEEQAREQPEVDHEESLPLTKICSCCGKAKSLSQFLRRSGRRSGKGARRGTCRACRKRNSQRQEKGLSAGPSRSLASGTGMPDEAALEDLLELELPPPPPKVRTRRPLPTPPPRPKGPDASVLHPTKDGFIRMRGQTDKGRRWYQETDLETAVVLVREFAAVVVNPTTIRRIYSNKAFRRYILTRDKYTCYYCGEYGDTLDHLLPRAKGGHTTPVNCVCACNLCNQDKADRSLEDFMVSAERDQEAQN